MDVRSAIQIWLKTHQDSVARELVETLYPQVASIVRRHLPQRMDIDDLTQEVFSKFFANLQRYDPQQPVENWLSRLTLNHCRDQLRRERARPELRWSDLSETQQTFFTDQSALSMDGAGDPVMAEDARRLVETVLQTLPGDDQILLRMLYLEGRGLKEVADLLNWSGPLTRLRAYRARQRAHKTLKLLKFQRQNKTF